MIRRRNFITLLGGAAAWPIAGRAQNSARMRRIAWMDSFREDDPNARARVKEFLQVIEKLGWAPGGNLAIDYRWNLFDVERAKLVSAEILSLAPDIILCGGTPSALVMQQATRTVPIVFAFVTDPVGQGIVTNLARPSSNITGFSYFEPAIASKWLELLKEIAPSIRRVALMFNPMSSPYSPLYYQSIAAAATKLAVEPVTALVRNLSDIEQVMTNLAYEQGGGLIISPDAFLYQNRKLIIELAARHRLPAVYGLPGTAAEGGLIYYVVDIVDVCRKAAVYIDRILRGEKVADLLATAHQVRNDNQP
jgi:putative tryptophan/tyrosine transport system substrate-binding protein